ncbi:hypothetical protein [Lentzea roselyniae]|uniref:hypothetical protein n=1 Tax=Lentzea roselyniae TaxID=531940 RepID=UPI0031F750FF
MLINTEGLVRARAVRYATASRFAEPEPLPWDGVITEERGPPARSRRRRWRRWWAAPSKG